MNKLYSNCNVEKKLQEIYNILTDYKSIDIGLHTGISGINIFLCYSDKNPQTIEIIKNNYLKAIDEINQGNIYHTFCSGIGGLAWSLELMAEEEVFERKELEILNQLDEYLYQKMMFDIKSGNYDFLHGAIGNGIYFLKRLHKNTAHQYLSNLISELKNNAEREKDTYKWLGEDDLQKLKGYNLSLSHGMASIASFLAKVYTKGIDVNKTGQLLTGTVNFLLKHQLDVNKYSSYFPAWVHDKSPLMEVGLLGVMVIWE